MKVSIITVCYNSDKTIERTIESVLSQKNIDLEYILVDGLSTDNTINIIKGYHKDNRNIMKFISEPDNGIYDAMNKGISLATGDIIGILNSDDIYASSSVLEQVVNVFSTNDIDSCYGDLVYVKNSKPFRYWKAGEKESFRFGWMPPHPSFFVKKNVYTEYGMFNLEAGINADYELMLRFLEKHQITTSWINNIFVYMNAGGVSNNGMDTRIKGIANDYLAWKLNNLNCPVYTIPLKKIKKIPQFFLAKSVQNQFESKIL